MSAHLVTTRVTGRRCHCGALVVTGHAEGLAATVDLAPLIPAGEALALLTGRTTYHLRRGELVHRDASRITGGSIHAPVLAEHRCGQPLPVGCYAPMPLDPPPAAPADTLEVPF